MAYRIFSRDFAIQLRLTGRTSLAAPTILLVLLCAARGYATPVADYLSNIEHATSALETLSAVDELEGPAQYKARLTATLNSVRTLLPLRQNVESAGQSYSVDNSWLHQSLEELEKVGESDRSMLLSLILERLKALHEQVARVEREVGSVSKEESKRKLEGILARPEYATKPVESSASSRLVQRFLRWFSSLFPRPKPLQPGSAKTITQFSQVFVVLLALAVIAYVLKVFAPKMRRDHGTKKIAKARPRVVLGERLEPEQSASDLLTEAEALARQGEVRAAIRKGYIALLVELGDRKVISLAQHKTNRDYLRALRERELLYRKMAKLTDSFERHWYGLAQATDTDWVEFRARYREALEA